MSYELGQRPTEYSRNYNIIIRWACSDERHFNVGIDCEGQIDQDKVHGSQPFERKGELKWNKALPLGQTGSR